ncbi:MAG: hypothetical protein V4635_00770 [Bacteroidota bacterium]
MTKHQFDLSLRQGHAGFSSFWAMSLLVQKNRSPKWPARLALPKRLREGEGRPKNKKFSEEMQVLQAPGLNSF